MKKTGLFLLSFLLLTAAGYSQGSLSQQQRNEMEDSVTSRILIRQVKQFLTISSAQETALHDAVVAENAAKRNVYQQYRKTESFQQQMAVVQQQRDSVLRAILGTGDFGLYQEKMEEIRQQKEAQLKERARQNED